MIRIGFVCPIYNAVKLHAYTGSALATFFETTPDGVAIVVDDGSKSWSSEYERRLQRIAERYSRAELHTLHYSKNGGLTRSWNAGLKKADELKLDYAIAGNNDILFTPRWYEGMLHALENGYQLVGPLSNAPGVTAKGKQCITKYVKNYTLSDDPAKLTEVATQIHQERLGQVVESPINGFFQLARMSSWRAGRYDNKHVYRPINCRYSNGGRNPTPLMTLNEDELQARWSRLGWRSAISLSSFVFHYRAVSRGDKYKQGEWYRKK